MLSNGRTVLLTSVVQATNRTDVRRSADQNAMAGCVVCTPAKDRLRDYESETRTLDNGIQTVRYPSCGKHDDATLRASINEISKLSGTSGTHSRFLINGMLGIPQLEEAY